MKTKIFMTIAAAATLLTACDKNNEMDATWNGEIRLSSGVEVETRAFTPTQGTQIANGEVVSVWVNDATASTALYKAYQLTADGSSNFTGTTMYFPKTGNGVNISAMHGAFAPAFSEGNEFPSSGVTFSVNADQSSSNAFIKSDLLYAYSPSVARTSNKVPLTFYHMLSKLEVAIKIGDGSPALKSNGAVSLGTVTTNGKFTPGTDVSTEDLRKAMLAAAASPATGSITLGQTTSTDLTAANVNYNEAIIVPQDMSSKTLTFTLADGGILKYTIPASTTFTSGKKYIYQITLKLSGLEVSSSIEDWTPVGAVQGDATM